MARKCIKIELDVFVDTDLEGVKDIIDGLEISVESIDENVDVDSHEVSNFYEVLL